MDSRLARAQALMDEGHRLRLEGDLDGAEAAFTAAAELAPSSAAPIHNRGMVRQLRGDWPGAEAASRRALELEPGRAISLAALGVALLGQGRFSEGFPLADAARELPRGVSSKSAPELPIPRLAALDDVAGKRILIWGEEGFGDQIMFARFARLLLDLGAQVSWICPPPLARLFDDCLGVVTIPAVGEIQLEGFDLYCPSSALPVVFMPGLRTPPPAPYLDLPPPRLGSDARIGVVTRSHSYHPNAPKSLPADISDKLLKLPDAIDLLPEASGAKDFFDTAAIMAGLDLVISVDTAAAHLAGALGKPLWVLMYEPAAEWRWMAGRADSPWYQTATVLRQTAPGDWHGLVNLVVERLAQGR